MNSSKNAIILAAGKSSNFAPFIYEKPKGLFRVRGEILIERQIKQLKDAGIDDIYIVVGYMKEKFFYLEEKYGVKLVANNTFLTKNNIYSLFVVKEFLANTFICCADQYFFHNPFIDKNEENISYRACMHIENKFSEFAVTKNENNVINSFEVGGKNSLAMVGHAYFNEEFSKIFVKYLENEINDFGVGNMFWEEFWAKHIEELPLSVKEYNKYLGFEFDTIEDLIRFDEEFLLNIDSKIVENITKTLNCEPNEIKDIKTIQAGLTNVSFSFCVKNNRYVYRHPGWTAGNLVKRDTELFAQTLAKQIGIDNSFITMGDEGWKISHFVDNTVKCDFKNNIEQRKNALKCLRKIHEEDISGARLLLRDFNPVEEGLKLIKIASTVKGDIRTEFKELIDGVMKLSELIRNSDFAKKRKKVLCHSDVYEPNFLITSNNEYYLIDWEYAGLNDAAFDLASILGRDYFSEDLIDEYIQAYLGYKPDFDEERHYKAYIPLAAFYYFCWGLYKGSVGEDDGFFFLPTYRNCMDTIPKLILAYEGDDK